MKTKRFFSILFCVCIVVVMMSAVTPTANAAETGAIQLGTSGIADGEAVYFGVWGGQTSASAIKCRVLDAAKGSATNPGSCLYAVQGGALVLADNSSAMLLVSEYLLDSLQFKDGYPDSNWMTSSAKVWLSDVFDNTSTFDIKERAAISYVKKIEVSTDPLFGNCEQNIDNVFFLSKMEADTYFQGMTGFRIAFTKAGIPQNWWLRTPGVYASQAAAYVNISGNVATQLCNNYAWARPAFNLNKNSVLFSSAAENGKPAGTTGSALTAVGATTSSAWKLTLLDSTRELTTDTTEVDTAHKTLTIEYSGASVGDHEYVSAVIIDSANNITHYGKIVKPTATTGTAIISTADLGAGDTLHVFSEQCNDDYLSDYASALQTVSTTPSKYGVMHTLANLTTNGPATVASNGNYTAALTAAAGYLLPSGISVTVGGVPALLVDSEAIADGPGEYYYNASTGAYKVAAVNGPVTVTASGVARTYIISTSPVSLVFSPLTEGYTTAPNAQTVTVTNIGNCNISGYTVTGGGTKFDVDYTSTAIAVGGTSTFTVRPFTGLAVGSHTKTLTVGTPENSTTTVALSFIGNADAPPDNEEDATMPTVVALTPSGAGNPISGDIVIKFSEAMSTTAVGAVYLCKDGGTTSGSALKAGSWSNYNTTFTTFYSGLTNSTKYTVNISGFTDIVGNTMAYSTHSFTTVAAPPSGGEDDTSNTGNTNNTDNSNNSNNSNSSNSTSTNSTAVVTDGGIIPLGSDYSGQDNPFTDVDKNDWFYDNVMYVYKNGLMKGTGSSTFSPDGKMTRAMFVTVLYRMSGDTGNHKNTFSDVSSSAWYYDAVAWAAANGIVSGAGDNRFDPDGEITREQLAVMLWRYAKYKGHDVSEGETANILSYKDASYISKYAYAALQWACGAGIINGDAGGNLNPKSSATRAETAAILKRFIEK
jgi:hypothetical protein